MPGMEIETNWRARAEREATVLIDECGAGVPIITRDFLVSLVAMAWLQGVNLGSHETLAQVERAFSVERSEL